MIGAFILVLGYALVNSLWKTAPNINTTLVNDQDLINRINENGLTFKAAANPNFNVPYFICSNISLPMSNHSLTFKRLINNNFISVLLLENKLSSLIPTISEQPIPSVQDQLLTKEIALLHILLLQLVLSLTDFALQIKKTIQSFLLKPH